MRILPTPPTGTSHAVLSRQTICGRPVSMGDSTLVPQSRVLVVRLPGATFIWNRPAAILLKQEDREMHYPIPDITRTIQLALFSLGLVMALGRVFWLRHQERSEHDDYNRK